MGVTPEINIESILSQISKNETVSDIHLSSLDFVSFRINGDIVKHDKVGKLTEDQVEMLLKQLLKGNQKALEKFVSDKESDFSYVSADGTYYRVNAFFKLGKVGIVLRKINSTVKALDELMFADIANTIKEKILTKSKGLFLVTGPTGSGKSTSIVSMIQNINESRNNNIITIEDPIEFVFTAQKSLISQREVGHDTWSFLAALRASMRENPDVLFVGEIRDKETAEATLTLAETGHLVFSTLHTPSASGTVNRYVSFFNPEIQESISDRLAEVLIGVQSQLLVKNADGKSRVGIYELMLNTIAIKNNIKRRQLSQIDSIIETSTGNGMISMAQYAKRLVEKGIIQAESVSWLFNAKA